MPQNPLKNPARLTRTFHVFSSRPSAVTVSRAVFNGLGGEDAADAVFLDPDGVGTRTGEDYLALIGLPEP